MVALAIETIGEERFIRGFSGIASDVQDMSEAFRMIMADFHAMESRIFSTEGSSEGSSPFKPLSPKYADWKAENFPGMPIMTLTGTLRTAMEGGSHSVRKIDRQSAEFGVTGLPYAHRHQMGTHGTPQRKFVQLSEDRKQAWAKIVVRWAMGLFEKYGIVSYGDYLQGPWI